MQLGLSSIEGVKCEQSASTVTVVDCRCYVKWVILPKKGDLIQSEDKDKDAINIEYTNDVAVAVPKIQRAYF